MSQEKEKLTFSQKVENFWYYYKWLVITCIVLILGVILLVQIYADTRDNASYDLKIESVFAGHLTKGEYDLDKRAQKLIADANDDGIKNVKLNHFYITEKRENNGDAISESQFEMELRNAKGDLFLFDEPNLNIYLKKDIFAPIEDYVDLSLVSEEDIIYRGDTAVAIKLSGSKILNEMEFVPDEVYAGIAFIPDWADESVTKSRDNAKVLIRKLLEK